MTCGVVMKHWLRTFNLPGDSFVVTVLPSSPRPCEWYSYMLNVAQWRSPPHSSHSPSKIRFFVCRTPLFVHARRFHDLVGPARRRGGEGWAGRE
jgi:hypothetical protein